MFHASCSKTINVGLIGFGVIGAGVAKVLQKNAAVIESRVGAKVVLKKIADLDVTTDRGVKLAPDTLTTDGFAVCSDPTIDVVIELVGGTGIAAKFIETALKNGKHVVSANKALLSEKGDALFDLAEASGKKLLFEAAVGGAIPIIRTLKEDLAGEVLDSVYGVVNGTCNYILTKMSREGVDFATALKEAQTAGFAEADPTLDVEGGDTAHKLALLATLAWGTRVPFNQIHVEGITKLAAHDFIFAEKLNRVIKLVAIGKRHKDGLELRVHPTLLPADSALAKINREVNAIVLRGPNLKELLLSGYGAGQLPTATAVVGDVIEAARGTLLNVSSVPLRAVPTAALAALPIKPIDDIETEYYLRFTVKDRPGVIRDISNVLAEEGLSIRDILQLDLKEFEKETPLVVILHRARESAVRTAVAKIDRLATVKAKTVVLRVEE